MGKSVFCRFFLYLNWQTLKKTIVRAGQRRLNGLAAEMAFNAMLAIFPLILACLTALSLFEKPLQITLAELTRQYKDVLPAVAWQLLENFVAEITNTRHTGLFSISFVVAIWISSGALGTAMNAMDEIHQIPARAKRPFWQAKLIAIFITLGTILLLVLASFIVIIGDYIVKFSLDLMVKLPLDPTGSALLLTLWQLLSWPMAIATILISSTSIYHLYQIARLKDKSPLKKARLLLIVFFILLLIIFVTIAILLFINYLLVSLEINYNIASFLVKVWQFFSWPVALGIVSVAFAFIYRIGPSHWRGDIPLFPGAILAALSWAGLSALFRLYVTNFANYNKVYGAVGAVIVLMIWLQMSSLMMLLGDQINVIVGEAMQTEKLEKQKSLLEVRKP